MKNTSKFTHGLSTKKIISYTVIFIHFAFILYICLGATVKKNQKKDPLIVRTKILTPPPSINPKNIHQTASSKNTEKKQHAPQASKKLAESIAKAEVKPAAQKPSTVTSQEKKTTQKPKESKSITPKQPHSTKTENTLDIPEDLLKNLEQKLSQLENIKQKPSKKPTIIVPDKIDPILISKYSRFDSFEFDDDLDSYPEYLAYFLKQELKLPDFGQVKVEITLNKAGCVEKCLVISSESAKNKKYLEEKLPNLIFPKFKNGKSAQETQQFVLTFCNEF